MSNIEKIKAEIERQLEYFKGKEDDAWDDCDKYTDEDAQWYQGHWKMCSKLLAFIDSLPEEKPSENPELTWEDVQLLDFYAMECQVEESKGRKFNSSQEFFEEVLRRFNKAKED